jgi:hypothetical protein
MTLFAMLGDGADALLRPTGRRGMRRRTRIEEVKAEGCL